MLVVVVGCTQTSTTQTTSEVAEAPTTIGKLRPDGVTEIDQTDQAPIASERWNLTALEQTWGIKLKRFTYAAEITAPSQYSSSFTVHRYRLLLEFTRDLCEEEVKEVNRVFNPERLIGLELVVRDVDSVVQPKAYLTTKVEGRLLGQKGDAFWLLIHDTFDRDKVAHRVELRRCGN